MKLRVIFLGLALAGCELIPWGKRDINLTPSARQTPGYQEVTDFLRYLKKGKAERAAELLSEEARGQWNIRLALIPERERKEFLRSMRTDTFSVDEDINRFIVKGKSIPPARIKVVRERGKRRLEF
ncbi:MAG: hypothetical protein ABIM88_01715 [candidate division WOR-3 bacterium]